MQDETIGPAIGVKKVNGPGLGINMDQRNGLEMRIQTNNNIVVGSSSPMVKKYNRSRRGSRGKTVESKNIQRDTGEGITGEKKDMEEQEHESSKKRRGKRGVSPSSLVGSGGGRSKKKRKAHGDMNFDGTDVVMDFNQGKTNGENTEIKKKIGRRSITKAMEVPRKKGVEGLGENKKGVSDAYKEYYDAGSESIGIFRFGHDNGREALSSKCNVSMEQVKEIGEIIGMISINVRGMGENGKKKGWIRSIIKDEQLDVIGIQETKSGVVDDDWIEDLWGGKGYGYCQLPAIGNSGGIIVMWDTRIFTCKEAIGDERFKAVRGSWKGKDDEMVWRMVYFRGFKCG
ncbi:hypothetical protein CTI12_AA466770 [Artemisia annua]|uniref:RNA-directed DNA polymerase, eukaryota, Reverse transcriptase zinc-binding domain protein n=1 Tax=Artemisia annua TaxID=35608 RepID=A0A2U1LPE1_ARTAN|nr:hypothetical protein CTI12_AA466770 [Artemisia annua]